MQAYSTARVLGPAGSPRRIESLPGTVLRLNPRRKSYACDRQLKVRLIHADKPTRFGQVKSEPIQLVNCDRASLLLSDAYADLEILDSMHNKSEQQCPGL